MDSATASHRTEMKDPDAAPRISLVFADGARPGSPLTLDENAVGKLGETPRLCKALAESYGTRLGEPILWGGGIYMDICDDSDLLGFAAGMVADLILTAEQLKENAQRQPPQPLVQAVTHRHCVDLLRAVTHARQKCGLVVTVDTDGHVLDLPRLEPSDFSEPATAEDIGKRINLDVVGLCQPREDVHVVILANLTALELPRGVYRYTLPELQQMIFGAHTRFVGSATPIEKGRWRAMPGGELPVQGCF